ncbi:MAG: restriction endonuclease [Fimbriimonadaceae bacterium]
MSQQEIEQKVAEQVVWWMGERYKKLIELRHESMSVNPFLVPLVFGMHDFTTFDELGEFLVSSHLATGYSTGFGKLIDEKILPKVFNTIKLDRATRQLEPLNRSMFDEIDHIIPGKDGAPDKLLSLKAGRWTIQLTMAVQLNKSFNEMIKHRDDGVLKPFHFDEIAVGVFYGTLDTLTDKYDILRGINRGANHDVVDVTMHVNVYAGKQFWAWLNEGEEETQNWVLNGITRGSVEAEEKFGSLADLMAGFKKEFAAQYADCVRTDGTVDWAAIVAKVNG